MGHSEFCKRVILISLDAMGPAIVLTGTVFAAKIKLSDLLNQPWRLHTHKKIKCNVICGGTVYFARQRDAQAGNA